ncbi:MAG: nuclear transport factor 2 family protein [Caulobacteraceae bacterium]
MSQAQHIADRYIATWNETDSGRRLALLGQDWTDDATYVDPLSKVGGRAEIDAMIGGVQTRFPGFRFAVTGRPDGHGDHVRFSWSLGPTGAEPPIEGSDVVMTYAGKIACVIGFLDKVPQAA